MTVLVDSDILIEVLRGRNQEIIIRWNDLGLSDAAVLCSAVSIAEIWAGARPSEHDALNHLFASLTCVPIDGRAGRQAGDYLRSFGKSHGLELGDALTAAAAAISRASLWTRNRKHYPLKELVFF